ncbi:MAG: CcdC protein domain-containing protein [Gammaproteobacteria bacterium]
MQTAVAIAVLALTPLLAWRIYARIRRSIGRQRLSRPRAWLTLTLFPMLLALLAVGAYWQAVPVAWLAAGLASGALLAIYGLRRTRFEATAEGVYYTPSAHLGVALSLLLVGRVLYRLVEVAAIDTSVLTGNQPPVLSPLTLALVGLLAGYYMRYALGLVRWRPPAA